MRVPGVRRRQLANRNERLDGRKGFGQRHGGGFTDMPDAQGKDEAIEFGFPAGVDRRKQLVEAFVVSAVDAADVLARLAGGEFALPRLLLAPLGQRLLHRRPPILEREDVGRGLDQPGVEEQVDVLGTEALDVHGAARHEMPQPLDRLGGADQFTRAAPARVRLAGLFIDLPDRRRAAHRTDFGKLVGHRALGPLVEDHPDDLRDHVPGPLDNDGVADADVDAVADRRAVAVEALDIVFVVQRHVLDHDATHGDRRKPRHRRQRAGAANLDINAIDGRGCLLGREFVRDGPAGFAGHRAPAPLQVEPVELIDHPVDVVAEARPLRLDDPVLGEQFVDGLGAHHQRADGKAPAGEPMHRIVLGLGGIFRRRAPGVGEEVELPAGGDERVLLTEGAGGGVARVDVVLPTRRRRARLERLELGIGHVDLAANLDTGRPALALEPMRDIGDRFEILGDILAHGAVAARGAAHEDAVLVEQRRREAIDLGLGGKHQLEVLVTLEEPVPAFGELDHVRVGIGLGEAEHRHRVPHLGEAFCRRRPHLFGEAVRPLEFGKRGLDFEIASLQRIVGRVGHFRRIGLKIGAVGGAEDGLQPVQFRPRLGLAETFDFGRVAHQPTSDRSREAAARASSVMVAPASMRATSSRRVPPSSART